MAEQKKPIRVTLSVMREFESRVAVEAVIAVLMTSPEMPTFQVQRRGSGAVLWMSKRTATWLEETLRSKKRNGEI
jgi:hypothetical protein